MKEKSKSIFVLLLFVVLTLTFFSCAGIKDTITNVQRLQFKLGSVDNFSLANVKLSNINSISNISLTDGALLLAAFGSGQLPASFTLNVIAKNPNDGTGGTPNTTAIIKSLAWRLLIDDKETINGNIDKNIEVPGVGQATTIPVAISLDLLKFFKDQGYESLVNLALALGGSSGSSARLTLKVQPTIDTFLGPITYPGEISVIDKEFRGQ
ncbi:MAG: hypothetical protein FJ216_04335 [Ignavibacteria bacterium]|nr:hypothetical protein [Ignavibacteria bacterium]